MKGYCATFGWASQQCILDLETSDCPPDQAGTEGTGSSGTCAELSIYPCHVSEEALLLSSAVLIPIRICLANVRTRI